MLEDVICLGTVCTVVFVFYILIAVWIYKDAESRGMSGLLWVVVVFLIGWIGLIIYLLVRNPKHPPNYYYGPPPPAYQYYPPPPTPQRQPGPSPQAKTKDDESVLGDPRVREEPRVTCKNCGASLDKESKFCGHCGTPLK